MKKNSKKTNKMNTVQTQQSVKKKEDKTEQRRLILVSSSCQLFKQSRVVFMEKVQNLA